MDPEFLEFPHCHIPFISIWSHCISAVALAKQIAERIIYPCRARNTTLDTTSLERDP